MILEMFLETGTVEIICPVKKGQSSSRRNKIRVDNTVTGTSLRKGREGGWVGLDLKVRSRNSSKVLRSQARERERENKLKTAS